MSITDYSGGYIESKTKKIKQSKYYMIDRYDVGLMSLRISTAPEFLCFGLKYVVEINGMRRDFHKSKRSDAFEFFNKEKKRLVGGIEMVVDKNGRI